MNYVPFALLTAVLFLRPEELFPEIAGTRLYLVTIVGALVLAAPGILRQLTPTELRRQPITVGVLGLLAAGVLAHLARGRQGMAADFAAEFGKVVLFYLLLVAVLDTRERLDAYLGWLVALVLGVAVLALFQHHGVIDWEALRPIDQTDVDAESGEVVVYPRLRGTGIFNDPNDLCLVLGIGVCCALYRGFETEDLLARLAWLAPVGAFLYALALTKSRGGALGVGAAAVAFVVMRYGWRKGALLLAVLIPAAAVLFAGRQTDITLGEGTGQERIRLWSDGLELLFRANPFTGIGPGEYVEELPQVAHNSFVHAYVETGLIGGAVFLGVFAVAVAALWHAARRDAGLAPYLFALTVGYVVGMLSLSRNYVVPTALVLGLATAYLNVADREPPAWYRVDRRLALVVVVLGVAGLVGVKAFVTLFARFGGA
jgi:putative inorganic carbon (HCO3(-)) transporter